MTATAQIRELDRDPVALRDAETRERRRETVDLSVELTIAHPTVEITERRAIAESRRGLVQVLRERCYREPDLRGNPRVVGAVPDSRFHLSSSTPFGGL
jgi:hypothetical protein